MRVRIPPRPNFNMQQQTEIKTNFFRKWSGEMAYILGFVAADGNVTKRKDRKDSYIFNITNKEKDILLKIRDLICPNRKLGTKRSGYTGKKDYYYLQLSDRQICKDLIKLGIIPRKTYSFELPLIPKKYFSDFTRGFFDGDGSVYIYNVNNTPQIKAGFVGCSESFLIEFNKILCASLKIPEKNIHKSNNQKLKKLPQYSICLYISDCDKLGEFMYKSKPSLFLSRKRKIFEDWKLFKRRDYIKNNYPSKIGWHLNTNQ